MVARAGGYYGAAFQGSRGVIQGDLLSPTIFNVMVDMAVRHWVVVIVEDTERGERGKEGRNHNALLYVDDVTVASSDP